MSAGKGYERDFGAHVRIHATPCSSGERDSATRRHGTKRKRERERQGGRERDRERQIQWRSWLRDEERMDQYRAIHAEVISLSTVSGGSRVAWRRDVGVAWRGVVWHGVA